MTVLFIVSCALLAAGVVALVAMFLVDAIRNRQDDDRPERYQPRHRAGSVREPYAAPEVVDPHYDPDTDPFLGEDWATLISGEWRIVAPLWTEEVLA